MIEYKVVERADPRDLNKAKKYYAATHTKNNAEFRDFINDIARLSTVNTPDIVAVIESLFQLIPHYLKEGKIIRLGELGSITVVLDSQGEETEEEVDRYSIKKARIRFIPSKVLRESVNNVEFRKYSQHKGR